MLAVRVLAAATLAVSFAACDGTATATPGSSSPGATGELPASSRGPAVLGIDWARAAAVERPLNYEETVSPSYPGTHPILRIAGQAMMADVVELATGGFTAVGYVPPDWHPVAWTSTDGVTWSIRQIASTEFTFPLALARGDDGTVVAVGRSGSRPIAWTSRDGLAWQAQAVPVLGRDGIAERMTSVAAGPGGFVAGGSVGPELLERHARFWTSPDGVAWQAVADDAGAFDDAEVRAITTVGEGYVAVGVVGTAQERTAAVAWTSADAQHWRRIDDAALVGGVAVSVAAAPGGGLVAVGSDLDRRNAVAWTSADGQAWTRAPDEPSRQHSAGYAWLTDVTTIGGELVAVGEIQGLQRGTAMAWVSRDGLSWQRANRAPVQEQGEFYAIVAGGPGAIVVGSFGAPDSYVPQVWLSPAR